MRFLLAVFKILLIFLALCPTTFAIKVRYLTLQPGEPPIHIKPGSSLRSGGVDPCLAFIIYNREKKEAFAGHSFSHAYVHDFTIALQMARKKWGNVELEVYAAGGSTGTPRDPNNALRNEITFTERRAFQDLLTSEGFLPENVILRWLPPESGGELIFNSTTGAVQLHVGSDTLNVVSSARPINEWPVNGGENLARCFEIQLRSFLRNSY